MPSDEAERREAVLKAMEAARYYDKSAVPVGGFNERGTPCVFAYEELAKQIDAVIREREALAQKRGAIEALENVAKGIDTLGSTVRFDEILDFVNTLLEARRKA